MISNPNSGYFYTISREKVSNGAYWEGKVGQTTFYLDNQVLHYERRVYNLYNMIGDIGGINQVVMSILVIIMNMYTNKVYDYFTANEFLKFRFKNRQKGKKKEKEDLKSTTTKIHPVDFQSAFKSSIMQSGLSEKQKTGIFS